MTPSFDRNYIDQYVLSPQTRHLAAGVRVGRTARARRAGTRGAARAGHDSDVAGPGLHLDPGSPGPGRSVPHGGTQL